MAVQLQLDVVVYIKRGELVVVAEQLRQRGIVAYIKRGELVVWAVQYAYLTVNGYGLRTKKVFHIATKSVNGFTVIFYAVIVKVYPYIGLVGRGGFNI